MGTLIPWEAMGIRCFPQKENKMVDEKTKAAFTPAKAFFEDFGMFYADVIMVSESLVLSVNTGLMYNLKDLGNVKIKAFALSMVKKAKEEIKADDAYWCGIAAVTTDEGSLIWEY